VTAEQKAKIADMRKNGYGYSAIGQALGISKNTIKTYCNRNGLSGVRQEKNKLVMPTIIYCKQCGAELSYTPGNKRRIFCNAQCRNAWWNAHSDRLKHRDSIVQCCPTCGKEITVAGKRKKKYCCFECYINDRFHKEGEAK